MAQSHARVISGVVIETFTTDHDIDALFPPGYFMACPSQVGQGWTFDGSTYAAAAVPAADTGPRYVPLATIRDRVTAAGKWSEFAVALDTLPADKRWHLLTLREGIASDDADCIALLGAIGVDAADVLAPSN